MHISFIADKFMPNTTRQAIGKYRHQVFVKELQWELPAAGEIEQDEFDVESAVHVLARGEHGGLVGVGRSVARHRWCWGECKANRASAL